MASGSHRGTRAGFLRALLEGPTHWLRRNRGAAPASISAAASPSRWADPSNCNRATPARARPSSCVCWPRSRSCSGDGVEQSPGAGADLFHGGFKGRRVRARRRPVATDLPHELQGGVVNLLVRWFAFLATERLDTSAHGLKYEIP